MSSSDTPLGHTPPDVPPESPGPTEDGPQPSSAVPPSSTGPTAGAVPPTSDVPPTGPGAPADGAPADPGTPASPRPASFSEPTERLSIGQLVSRVTEQLARLVRAEIDLAKAEMQIRAQNAAIGIGMFVVAGVLSLYGLGWLLNSAALGLANVVAPWLAALIVGVVLMALTATLALVGKRSLSRGLPPTPEHATQNVKLDVAAVKEGFRS